MDAWYTNKLEITLKMNNGRRNRFMTWRDCRRFNNPAHTHRAAHDHVTYQVIASKMSVSSFRRFHKKKVHTTEQLGFIFITSQLRTYDRSYPRWRPARRANRRETSACTPPPP
ncbi:hypothetical protein B5X24_HaOG213036 [Helicoverpa armigera]|nr:hypothetical protein B5X24_HaOG213036 [Helicoverpa armigera]